MRFTAVTHVDHSADGTSSNSRHKESGTRKANPMESGIYLQRLVGKNSTVSINSDNQTRRMTSRVNALNYVYFIIAS